MKIISGVSVRGFRSIRAADISHIGELTAIAGLNNSGKSNLLRALNAFFTGEVEPGVVVDIGRDFYRQDMGKKKARRIRVSVSFGLPSSFNFRRDLGPVQDLLGDRFEIAKEWSRGHDAPTYFLDGAALDLEKQRRVEQFFQLINFRYVPNRVLPLDVIRGEHQALRDALVRRVSKKAKGSENAFESLRETSSALISTMASRVEALQPDAGAVRLATPTSWRDMVFAFGYMLDQGGTELEDLLQGSGLQSVLMLETLHLIDQDYFQKFGWRQAAIWAIEEPESSLHTSLEVQVASLLQRIATTHTSRLQVLCTTHSDLMIQYSTGCLLAAKMDSGTTFQPIDDPLDAVALASDAGVSRWVHPLLYYPLDTIVLVEGRHDVAFLTEAFRIAKPGRRVTVTSLEELGKPNAGGVDTILRYVKDNAGVIRARNTTAPVIVALDWDARAKVTAFEKLFTPEDPFAVLAWPESEANPKLGRTFRGIERFYPDRLIEEAEKQGHAIARRHDGVASVEPDIYGSLKRHLSDTVRLHGLQHDDLVFAKPFVDRLLELRSSED